MRTTQEDIRNWLESSRKPEGATHMIVVCDTFDHGDYPVYVKSDQSVQAELEKIKNSSMTRIMEVYSYAMPIDVQLNERRAWNI